jgi:hypothetical protein
MILLGLRQSAKNALAFRSMLVVVVAMCSTPSGQQKSSGSVSQPPGLIS